MFQSESFPAPLDSSESTMYPSKYHHRGRSMFAGCFPMPARHTHSNSSRHFSPSRQHSSSRARNFSEEMLEKGRRFGGGGRSYFSNYSSSSGNGLLPPSFITREEEENGKTSIRSEECTFPDINDMTFPSPVEYRYRQGGPMPWHSPYKPVSNVGGSGSHRMFSSSYSPFSKRERNKRHGSFISLASYDVPPDFEAPTSRGRPLENRRGSLSKDYQDESYYSGYMSLWNITEIFLNLNKSQCSFVQLLLNMKAFI